jgi:hypothetical protein
MLEPERIPTDYTERLRLILHEAWRVLKSQFLDGRYPVHTEAPFQHYFAQIIGSLGSLYCTRREDTFILDLESKCVNIKGKNKYIDITCGFPVEQVSCAIELKFKTAKQGAQDHGRIDMYVDIEAVELACLQEYTFGKFYAITDSTPYVNRSKKGVGAVFCTHHGAKTAVGQQFACPQSKGREDVAVNLRNAYTFEWEQIDEWYFLELDIQRPSLSPLQQPE